MKKLTHFYLVTVSAGFFFIVFIPSVLVILSQKLSLTPITHPLSQLVGLVLMFTGLGLFLHSSSMFISHGDGTPLITEPPKKFVINGLYRRVRNPMYVGHLSLLLGEFLILGSPLLLGYAVAVFLCLHLFLVLKEEPQLKKRYGSTYEEYLKKVPRWGLF